MDGTFTVAALAYLAHAVDARCPGVPFCSSFGNRSRFHSSTATARYQKIDIAVTYNAIGDTQVRPTAKWTGIEGLAHISSASPLMVMWMTLSAIINSQTAIQAGRSGGYPVAAQTSNGGLFPAGAIQFFAHTTYRARR